MALVRICSSHIEAVMEWMARGAGEGRSSCRDSGLANFPLLRRVRAGIRAWRTSRCCAGVRAGVGAGRSSRARARGRRSRYSGDALAPEEGAVAPAEGAGVVREDVARVAPEAGAVVPGDAVAPDEIAGLPGALDLLFS